MHRKSTIVFALATLLATPVVAFADDTSPSESPKVEDNDANEANTGDSGATAPPSDSGTLPPVESDNDPQPEVAGTNLPSGGLVKQAGVGGTVGYGRAGVLELGGFGGLTVASGFKNFNFSPTVGWFLADNLELSAIFGISWVSAGGESATFLSALAEPSYHIPFNRTLFGFLGIGLGGSWIKGSGGGFAVAPRVGMNWMVGRSGVLTPSVSWQYTTTDVMTAGGGDTTVLAVSSALRVNIGYTVMW